MRPERRLKRRNGGGGIGRPSSTFASARLPAPPSVDTGEEHGLALCRSVSVGSTRQLWNRVTVVCPREKWVARSPHRGALRHWSLRHSPVSHSAALVVDTVDRGSGVRVSGVSDGGVSTATRVQNSRRQDRLMWEEV